MNKINWKQKLSSRKLWAALIGVAVGVAEAFGLGESEWSELAGIITSLVSVAAYIFSEASVDKARILGETTVEKAVSAEDTQQESVQ